MTKSKKQDSYTGYRLELWRYGDKDQKELVKAFELADDNAVICANAPEVGVNHLRTREDVEIRISEACVIDQRYTGIATKLCEQYAHIIPREVVPERICFVIDQHWEPTEAMSDNSKWKADAQKAPVWLRRLTGYAFVIRLRQHWITEWKPAQLAAAILSQLLRINPKGDGSVTKYSLDFQDVLTATFGIGYLEPGVDIPDLLATKIDLSHFRDASGQMSIYDLEPDDEDPTEELADESGDEGSDGSEGDVSGAGDEAPTETDAEKLAAAEAYMDSLEPFDSSEDDEEGYAEAPELPYGDEEEGEDDAGPPGSDGDTGGGAEG
jgi:hypothetical protein